MGHRLTSGPGGVVCFWPVARGDCTGDVGLPSAVAILLSLLGPGLPVDPGVDASVMLDGELQITIPSQWCRLGISGFLSSPGMPYTNVSFPWATGSAWNWTSGSCCERAASGLCGPSSVSLATRSHALGFLDKIRDTPGLTGDTEAGPCGL